MTNDKKDKNSDAVQKEPKGQSSNAFLRSLENGGFDDFMGALQSRNTFTIEEFSRYAPLYTGEIGRVQQTIGETTDEYKLKSLNRELLKLQEISKEFEQRVDLHGDIIIEIPGKDDLVIPSLFYSPNSSIDDPAKTREALAGSVKKEPHLQNQALRNYLNVWSEAQTSKDSIEKIVAAREDYVNKIANLYVARAKSRAKQGNCDSNNESTTNLDDNDGWDEE